MCPCCGSTYGRNSARAESSAPKSSAQAENRGSKYSAHAGKPADRKFRTGGKLGPKKFRSSGKPGLENSAQAENRPQTSRPRALRAIKNSAQAESLASNNPHTRKSRPQKFRTGGKSVPGPPDLVYSVRSKIPHTRKNRAPKNSTHAEKLGPVFPTSCTPCDQKFRTGGIAGPKKFRTGGKFRAQLKLSARPIYGTVRRTDGALNP